MVAWLVDWLVGWLTGHWPNMLQEHFHCRFDQNLIKKVRELVQGAPGAFAQAFSKGFIKEYKGISPGISPRSSKSSFHAYLPAIQQENNEELTRNLNIFYRLLIRISKRNIKERAQGAPRAFSIIISYGFNEKTREIYSYYTHMSFVLLPRRTPEGTKIHTLGLPNDSLGHQNRQQLLWKSK